MGQGMLGGFQAHIAGLPPVSFILPLRPESIPGPADGAYPQRQVTLRELLAPFAQRDWCSSQRPPPPVAAEDWISKEQLDWLMAKSIDARKVRQAEQRS